MSLLPTGLVSLCRKKYSKLLYTVGIHFFSKLKIRENLANLF